MSEPTTVICSYRPHEGHAAFVTRLVKGHVPMLRRRDLLADTPTTVLEGQGVLVEIFEWASEAASRAAHTDPVVQAYWAKMAEVCDFVPLASLAEAARPFAHFKRIA